MHFGNIIFKFCFQSSYGLCVFKHSPCALQAVTICHLGVLLGHLGLQPTPTELDGIDGTNVSTVRPTVTSFLMGVSCLTKEDFDLHILLLGSHADAQHPNFLSLP